jgi:hypothetical protein
LGEGRYTAQTGVGRRSGRKRRRGVMVGGRSLFGGTGGDVVDVSGRLFVL